MNATDWLDGMTVDWLDEIGRILKKARPIRDGFERGVVDAAKARDRPIRDRAATVARICDVPEYVATGWIVR